MSEPLRRIVRRRDLGPTGLNLGCGRTIIRWVESGRFPAPDLFLPGREMAWFRESVDRWLAEQSKAAKR